MTDVPVLLEIGIAFLLGMTSFLIFSKIRNHLNGMGEAEHPPPTVRRITQVIRGRLLSESRKPRVMVSNPEVKTPICQICLGRIKEGSNHVLCHCGRTFHIVCLSRTGFCPYCQERYDVAKLRSRRKEGSGVIVCPVCGRRLSSNENECECGAIILEEGSQFPCPICGRRILPSERSCTHCGTAFDSYQTIACPVCGQILSEDVLICDCGTVIGDSCPECHNELGPDDRICSECGAEFEFA